MWCVLSCFFRDDLYRVELDNMAGDEMFYSKVRLIFWHTHKTEHTLLTDTHGKPFLTVVYSFFLFQKRTWESNKNDIRVCRMKGKHEV